jgi:hypothetical protein
MAIDAMPPFPGMSKPRQPLVYDKGVIIVARGSKRVYLDNRIYDYNPDNYLVLALPIPAECETHATPGQPLLSMMVDIDLGVLNTIIEQIDTHIDHAGFVPECACYVKRREKLNPIKA